MPVFLLLKLLDGLLEPRRLLLLAGAFLFVQWAGIDVVQFVQTTVLRSLLGI